MMLQYLMPGIPCEESYYQFCLLGQLGIDYVLHSPIVAWDVLMAVATAVRALFWTQAPFPAILSRRILYLQPIGRPER